MLSLIQKCCEYIFPTRTDYKLVKEAAESDVKNLIKVTCRDDFVWLMEFKKPLARALVHEAKFHGNDKAWTLLASVMTDYLKQAPNNTVVIPIPISPKRLKERGYNQVTEVLKRVPNINLGTDVLSRRRHTAPQTTLKKEERLKNMENAFWVGTTQFSTNTPVIIVDDVMTTGATLKAARDALASVHQGPITLLSLTH